MYVVLSSRHTAASLLTTMILCLDQIVEQGVHITRYPPSNGHLVSNLQSAKLLRKCRGTVLWGRGGREGEAETKEGRERWEGERGEERREGERGERRRGRGEGERRREGLHTYI